MLNKNVIFQSIPAAGLVMWYNLDKRNRTNSRGLIKIRLTFSSEKNRKVAVQEHRHLLRILLMHELESSKVAPYWWAGKFSPLGETILTQHYAQSGLTSTDDALVKWGVYSEIHHDHPLAFSLFVALLDKLTRPMQGAAVDADDLQVFWGWSKETAALLFCGHSKAAQKDGGR